MHVAAQVDDVWQGSERRAVLTATFGPVDWTTNAAIASRPSPMMCTIIPALGAQLPERRVLLAHPSFPALAIPPAALRQRTGGAAGEGPLGAGRPDVAPRFTDARTF